MINIIYILSIIGFIALLFILVDAIYLINEWQQRIHIGRWQDRKSWQQAVEKKAKSWLKHSPTTRITDQNRLVLWDMFRGNYRSSTIQSWQDAGLLLGLEKEDAISYLNHHPNLFHSSHIEFDQALLAYALKEHGLLSPEQENKIKDLFQSYYQVNSTIPYRKQLPNIRFVDTLGLICPFLHACGWNELAVKQIKEYDDFLLNGVFPPHAFNKKSQTPMGIYDWNRGLGWYILCLIETETLERNHERILHLANSLIPYQRIDGGYNCMFFNPLERFESSGTALIGLLYIKAYELSNELKYLAIAQNIERSLMKATRRNGAVDYAQGDTKGIGFYSRTFSIMPFAQGMTLYLSKKINQHEAIPC